MTIIEHHSIKSSMARSTVPTIAGVEMWERFSFYGMQAILAYYLYSTVIDGGLGMEQTHATALLGAYGSLLYLFTFVGGWIADHLLGAERTLLTGALMLVFGHLCLSLVPGYTGLIAGLLPIAAGSGLLKTAAITILGAAFASNPGARDASFQVFYCGINIGGLFGPLLTGWLAQRYNYHVGFMAAGMLMIIGLLSYAVGRRFILKNADDRLKDVITKPAHPLGNQDYYRTAAAALACCIAGICAVLWLDPTTISYVLLALTVAVAGFLMWTMFRSPLVTAAERIKVREFLPIFVCSVVYWCLQSQIYGVLAVYSEQRLNREVFGFLVPAAWTQSLNPLFILLFSPMLAAFFLRYSKFSPHDRTLTSIGVIIAGAGMFLLLPFTGTGPGSTPFLILGGTILLMTLGELFVGPVAMAAAGTHAPRAFNTRFSALYFLTMAIGSSLAGALSTFYDPNSPAGETFYLAVVGIAPVALGAILLMRARMRRA